MTPLLVSKHLVGGAEDLGFWQALFAVGTILGGIALGVWGGFGNRIVTALLGLILLGTGTIIIGLAPANLLWLGLAANTFTGFVMPITNGSFGATLQGAIAADMQGRVFAFILSAATLVSPIGLMIAGPMADHFGIQTWFQVAGTVCALMGVAGFFIPDVMGMGNPSAASAPAGAGSAE